MNLDEEVRRDSSELGRGNEAEETGQVRENLHGSRDQRGNWVNERPPVLKTVSREIIARTQAQDHSSASLGRQEGRANPPPKATKSSSTSVSPGNSTGAMRA